MSVTIELTQAKFSNLWKNYLVSAGSKLITAASIILVAGRELLDPTWFYFNDLHNVTPAFLWYVSRVCIKRFYVERRNRI